MPYFEFDSIELSEVCELLSLAPYDLDNPKRYSKFRSIMEYFQGRKGKREMILRIIQKSHIGDPLDAVWNWVELVRERHKNIQSLDKGMFEEDVIGEIEKEFIKNDTIKKVNEQIDEKITNLKREKAAKEQEEVATNKKEKESVKKAEEISKLLETKKTLEVIESTNNLLNEY